ncbi:helix-turn-helix domain-containing protein [Oenococcus sicerae]|uniref:XRE family transcriptional regulator n=1 Tax=Oenococcus sicerae TaxID=2203724 RepID=A0AAJ1VMT2_9LACO|nr:helix-turn-helix transcriptional regulator [Oenococcus sicerae]MDN6900938.1 XRE family transcriptional regulator [Oenococcus sicerae]
MIVKKEFAQLIRMKRAKDQISMNELESITGVSRSTLSKIELEKAQHISSPIYNTLKNWIEQDQQFYVLNQERN